MSTAMVELEQANIALEDLILAEMNDSQSSTGAILNHLELSEHGLRTMLTSISALRRQMDEGSFEDLPSLRDLNLVEFGQGCAEAGLHRDTESFVVAVNAYNQGGFRHALDLIEKRAVHLMSLTSALIKKIDDAGDLAEAGELTAALEENTSANFRVEFARLYTAWANFQQFFLASVLISTELWYRFNKTGSILKTSSANRQVA